MLLVSDSGKDRVSVFTQGGQLISTFGTYGSRLGEMNLPFDVAVTPDGKVLVLEYVGKRLQVWQ